MSDEIDINGPESGGLRAALYDPEEYDGFDPYEDEPFEGSARLDARDDGDGWIVDPNSEAAYQYEPIEPPAGSTASRGFEYGVNDIEVFWAQVSSISAPAIRDQAEYWRRIGTTLSETSLALQGRRDALSTTWHSDAADLFMQRIGGVRFYLDEWTLHAENTAEMLDWLADDVDFVQTNLGTFYSHYQWMLAYWHAWPREMAEMVVYDPTHPGWTADFDRVIAPLDVQHNANHIDADMTRIGPATSTSVTDRQDGATEIARLYHAHAVQSIEILGNAYLRAHSELMMGQPRGFPQDGSMTQAGDVPPQISPQDIQGLLGGVPNVGAPGGGIPGGGIPGGGIPGGIPGGGIPGAGMPALPTPALPGGGQLAGLPIDPATGLPLGFDPATGLPAGIDPATALRAGFDPATGLPAGIDPAAAGFHPAAAGMGLGPTPGALSAAGAPGAGLAERRMQQALANQLAAGFPGPEQAAATLAALQGAAGGAGVPAPGAALGQLPNPAISGVGGPGAGLGTQPVNLNGPEVAIPGALDAPGFGGGATGVAGTGAEAGGAHPGAMGARGMMPPPPPPMIPPGAGQPQNRQGAQGNQPGAQMAGAAGMPGAPPSMFIPPGRTHQGLTPTAPQRVQPTLAGASGRTGTRPGGLRGAHGTGAAPAAQPAPQKQTGNQAPQPETVAGETDRELWSVKKPKGVLQGSGPHRPAPQNKPIGSAG